MERGPSRAFPRRDAGARPILGRSRSRSIGNGKILGVRGAMLHDTGAYLPWGIIVPFIAATTLPGPYVIPTYRIDCTVALTNRVPSTVVRGAGRPQAVFAMERLMDRVARETWPRPRRTASAISSSPGRCRIASASFSATASRWCMTAATSRTRQQARSSCRRYRELPQRDVRPRPAPRARIRIGFAQLRGRHRLGPFEGVTVRVLLRKSRCRHGRDQQGQGTRTTLSQIVADSVGCRMEDIVITVGDTAAIANGVGAFASRQAVNAGSSAQIAGSSVTRASGRARRASARRSARGTSTSPTDRRWRAPATSRAVLRRTRAPVLRACLDFRCSRDRRRGSKTPPLFTPPQAAYCSGTHVAEVEVDVMTGGVKILNYSVAHDAGNIINPLIVDGQVQGGVAHGVGNALFEWMKYDDDGQPLTTTFHEYLLPGDRRADLRDRACRDADPAQSARRQGRGRGRHHPAPAAIVSAIEDALSPFEVHFAEMPLTPERIVMALRRAGAYEKLTAA